MYKFFGILILSAIFTGVLMVPFINLLYFLKFRVPKTLSVDSLGRKTIYGKLQDQKIGTPTGGGVLLIAATIIFSAVFYIFTQYNFNWTTSILFITLFAFGTLGFYDDWQKFFGIKKENVWLFKFKYKLIVQTILGLIIGWLIYDKLDVSMLNIPVLTEVWGINLDLGILFVPFAAFTIVSSCNSFNITDGLDGLSAGLLVIALSAFWVLAPGSVYGGDVMVFLATVIGTLLIYLYFNIFPARIFYGDTGALAFGAMIAVVALVLNQSLILPIIGGVFVVEGASSLIQILSFKYRNGKRVFKIAPLHHHFQAIGWEETKVTMRFWLAGMVLAFVGLFLATFGLN